MFLSDLLRRQPCSVATSSAGLLLFSLLYGAVALHLVDTPFFNDILSDPSRRRRPPQPQLVDDTLIDPYAAVLELLAVLAPTIFFDIRPPSGLRPSRTCGLFCLLRPQTSRSRSSSTQASSCILQAI